MAREFSYISCLLLLIIFPVCAHMGWFEGTLDSLSLSPTLDAVAWQPFGILGYENAAVEGVHS